MTDTFDTDWQSMFVGRSDELHWLQDAWKLARDGKPQLRVLRGESGLGKTKIVQEFYSWLSRTDVADPDNYWPASLLQGDNLRLNPELSSQSLGQKMHYLWWGLRWLTPEGRNKGEVTHCAFYDQRIKIKPHWEHLSRYKDTALATLNLGSEIGTIAMDFAKEAAANIFPMFGFIKTVVGATKAVADIGLATYEFGAEIREHRLSAHELQEKELKEQVDQTVAFLSWILKPFYRSGSGSLPVALVLDDAQWIDQRSIDVVRNLFLAADRNNWPLLIIATHWEREWNEQLVKCTTATSECNPSETRTESFASLFQLLQDKAPDSCSITDVPRLYEQHAIIKAAFPGLTLDQIEYLAKRADGNPRLLHEMLLYLEDEPYLFENQDTAKALIHSGLDDLATDFASLDLNRLQERRFKRLDTELQELLAIGSLQGMRFLADLVQQIAIDLELQQKTQYVDLLDKAVYPHAILSRDGMEREFRFKLFHDNAINFMKRLGNSGKINLKQLRQTLMAAGEQWIRSKRIDTLSDSERENLLLMLLNHTESDHTSRIRLLGWIIQHYQKSGYPDRGAEWFSEWWKLVPHNVIHFNPQWTRLRVHSYSFFDTYVLFELTNYDCLPVITMKYLSDGAWFFPVDGTSTLIHESKIRAQVTINEDTVIDYLCFYFSNTKYHEGDSLFIKDPTDPAIKVYPEHIQNIIKKNYTPLVTRIDPEFGNYLVQSLLVYYGSLFRATIEVTHDGVLTVREQALITDNLPIYAEYYWSSDYGLLTNRDININAQPARDIDLDSTLHGNITAPDTQHLIDKSLQLLDLSEESTPLVEIFKSENMNISIITTPREFLYLPRNGNTAFISLTPYRQFSTAHFVLLLADILIEKQIEIEGRSYPHITEDKENYVKRYAELKAEKIAELCAVAYDLSLQNSISQYDFIGEMRSMGHEKAIDIFIQHV